MSASRGPDGAGPDGKAQTSRSASSNRRTVSFGMPTLPRPHERPRNVFPINRPPADEEEEEVRPDSREAAPSASAHRASRLVWDKTVPSIANPPPAYGRWRGSVRADPELLHWAAVPSPTELNTPALPSPTYEEAMAAAREEGISGPPSYVARGSPARRREVVDAARAQGPEIEAGPEMVEGRGIGIAE